MIEGGNVENGSAQIEMDDHPAKTRKFSLRQKEKAVKGLTQSKEKAIFFLGRKGIFFLSLLWT